MTVCLIDIEIYDGTPTIPQARDAKNLSPPTSELGPIYCPEFSISR